ncbi:MAG: hypothetical protein M3336_10905 [Chloroflexota bacterium]|nr:hypothetical protein [Chloroflexota bacterium]
MTLVTLSRRAPVAPDAQSCRLCDDPIGGGFQDHLLVGQPGTAQVRAVICSRCGEVLARLIELCGNNLNLLARDEQPGQPRKQHNLPSPVAEIDQTRHRLAREADTLGRTADTLRAEAEKLGVVGKTEPPR